MAEGFTYSIFMQTYEVGRVDIINNQVTGNYRSKQELSRTWSWLHSVWGRARDRGLTHFPFGCAVSIQK